jgi:hypothetical protein
MGSTAATLETAATTTTATTVLLRLETCDGMRQKLQVKIAMGTSANTLQCLVRSRAKPCSSRQEVAADLGSDQVRRIGEEFGSTLIIGAGMLGGHVLVHSL